MLVGIRQAIDIGQLQGFCPAGDSSLLWQDWVFLEWLGMQPPESMLTVGNPNGY